MRGWVRQLEAHNMRDELLKRYLDGIYKTGITAREMEAAVAGTCKTQPQWKDHFCNYGIEAAVDEYLKGVAADQGRGKN
jgi:hypothetical protein